MPRSTTEDSELVNRDDHRIDFAVFEVSVDFDIDLALDFARFIVAPGLLESRP